jgi:hypothetical protein
MAQTALMELLVNNAILQLLLLAIIISPTTSIQSIKLIAIGGLLVSLFKPDLHGLCLISHSAVSKVSLQLKVVSSARIMMLVMSSPNSEPLNGVAFSVLVTSGALIRAPLTNSTILSMVHSSGRWVMLTLSHPSSSSGPPKTGQSHSPTTVLTPPK